MRKKMNKKIAACGALSAALLLAGCANDGTAYRSDVYWAGQVNQAQEVKTVQIIAVMPARITVDNRRDRSDRPRWVRFSVPWPVPRWVL